MVKAVTTKSMVLPTGLSESKSASVGLDRLIREEAGLGNTCLLRNVISFFFVLFLFYSMCYQQEKSRRFPNSQACPFLETDFTQKELKEEGWMLILGVFVKMDEIWPVRKTGQRSLRRATGRTGIFVLGSLFRLPWPSAWLRDLFAFLRCIK